jgi:uncharacterized protein (TIGR03000 family)
MVRSWFSIAGALAIAGVMLTTDVSHAQGPLQRLRDRFRGTSDDGTTGTYQGGPLQRFRDRMRGTSDEGTTTTSRFGFRRAYYRNGEPVETVVSSTPVASNSVALDIRVPANAEVWVNDSKIKQTGRSRTFTAPDLTSGQTYSYKVKGEWTDAGKKITREQTVEARPGQRMRVDLTRSRTAPEELKQPKQSKENGQKE